MGAVGRRILVAAVVLAGLLAVAVASAATGGRPGTLDPTFGKGGTVVAKPPREAAESEYTAAARRPDGSVAFLLRRTTLAKPATELELRAADGAPVRSFGHAGRLRLDGGTALAAAPDGNLVVAVSGCGGRHAVEMLDGRGDPVTAFGRKGCSDPIASPIDWIGIDTEGRIVVAGSLPYCEPCSKSTAPRYEDVFARLLPDGSLDPSFGEGGTIHTRAYSSEELARLNAETGHPEEGAAKAAAAEVGLPRETEAEFVTTAPSGDTYVLINEFRGPHCRPCTPIPYLARLTPAGTRDPAYGENGIVRLPTPREGFFASTLFPKSLQVAADGSALVAGRIGDGDAFAVAVTPDGTLRRGFGKDGALHERFGRPARPAATGLTVGSHGELIVAAERASAPGLRAGFALTFGADGRQRPPHQSAVETLTRGTIVPDGPGRIVGWGGEPEDRVLLAAKRDGRRVKGYGDNGSARMPRGFVPQAIAAAPGGGVAVFGRLHDQGVAVYRVGPSGHPLAGFGKGGLAVVPHAKRAGATAYGGLVEADGDVVMTGTRGGIFAARLLPDGRPDPGFGHDGLVTGLDPNGYGTQIATLDGGVVIANGSRGDSGEVGPRLIRLDSAGHLVRSFGRGGYLRTPGAYGPIALFTGGGRIVTVSDPYVETGKRSHGGVVLAAYGPDGSIDRDFGDGGQILYGSSTNASGSVDPVAAVQQPGGAIVVAGNRGYEEHTKLILVRFR
jgi:uncharacterized delta-60 repeat protein